MKNLIIVFITVFLSTSLSAQIINISERQYFKQFNWEVSGSVSLALCRTSFESTSQYYSNGNNDDNLCAEISVLLGFFIIDGLPIEPELEFNFLPHDAALSLIANVSYTINISRKNIYPFFKIGYGVSGYKYIYDYYQEDSKGLFESLNANVINASAGLKIVQSSSFAMRLELNYKNISYDQTVNTPFTDQYDISTKTSVISIKFGGSFLL